MSDKNGNANDTESVESIDFDFTGQAKLTHDNYQPLRPSFNPQVDEADPDDLEDTNISNDTRPTSGNLDGDVEMGLLSNVRRKRRTTNYGKMIPNPFESQYSLFAKTPIQNTESFEELMIQERALYLIIYLIFVVASPLVFRYGLGSNIINDTYLKRYQPVDNATLHLTTDWPDCMNCHNFFGITLRNITVEVWNVTSPDINGNVPSVALFASQDFKNWYNLYTAENLHSAYIDNWEYTKVNIFNQTTSVACLGGVYHNYIVACLNTRNYATTLEKGDILLPPPFNDRCFMLDGICGIPCFEQSKTNPQYPKYCEDGKIPLEFLSTNASKVEIAGTITSTWASGFSWIEWVVLITIFLDTLGNVLRYLPGLSGRPTELESARSCICEGKVILGCVSPFVSEDEAIFLRSLIGRTCTIFHTLGGRHSLQGLYVDIILNEKRGKGEETRKMMWIEWLKFITLLAHIGASDEDSVVDNDSDENEDHEVNDDAMNHEVEETSNQPTSRRARESTVKFDAIYQRDSSFQGTRQSERSDRYSADQGVTISPFNGYGVNGARNSTASVVQRRKSSSAGQPNGTSGGGEGTTTRRRNSSIVGLQAIAFSEENPMGFRSSCIRPNRATLRLSQHEIVNFEKYSRASEVAGQGGGLKSHDLLSKLTPVSTPHTDDFHEEKQAKSSRLEYPSFDINENLEFDMSHLLPLICFLDGWLEAIKKDEWTYNYVDKNEALESIFNAAPIEVYFEGEALLAVHNSLQQLYKAFVSTSPDSPDANLPIFSDNRTELNWRVVRTGLPEWTLAWTYMSRARLRPAMAKNVHNTIPSTLYECTKFKPGAIVHLLPNADLPGEDAPLTWLEARAKTYKIINVKRSVDGTNALLEPWPVKKDDPDPSKSTIVVPLEEIRLVEKNRGKAGALNIALSYLKSRGTKYVTQEQIRSNIQIFMGIIDARHMLAEPEIFWNDGLAFFSHDKYTGASSKGESSGKQHCIIVQYPQYFTNVTRDDFLDNKNSSYYTVWQTLRDCSKSTTSSGTNAIWEITNKDFEYATTSRIEDTGTSQKYIPRYIAVHLPCFVAYGIAKKTEDYIEALYRWSTGAVELYWSTFFSSQFSDFIIIALISALFAAASFLLWGIWYILWIAFLIILMVTAVYEKSHGHKPLRRLIVSSVIVMNTMYWISNFLSPVWTVVVPIYIAFYRKVPLSATLERSLFWGFCAILVRMPPAMLTDRVVNMCKFLSLRTEEWNYAMVLWRSSQLYSASFGYAVLSFLTGTKNAFRAKFQAADLTMWSSFRVSDDAFTKAKNKIRSAESIFSKAFWTAVMEYLHLVFQGMMASLTMPDVLTKWYSVFVFVLQLVCMFVSINITNADDVTAIFITLTVCGLNVLLVMDIAVLLMPSITLIIGRPARPEYVFAFLGLTVVISALYKRTTTFDQINEFLKIEFDY